MRTWIRTALSSALLVVCLPVVDIPAAAQGTTPPAAAPSVYRVDFTVREMEGTKRVSSRSYTMLLENGSRGYSRVGTKVAVPTGANRQIQYVDVGLNIDCGLNERDGFVRLNTSLEVSDIAPPEPGKPADETPNIRQLRTSVTALVQTGRPTILSTVDDVTGHRRLELEAVATKLK